MKIHPFCYLFISFFYLNTNYATESLLEDCETIQLTKETIQLSKSKPALIAIHNITETNLWITHPISNPSASAGWSSHLHPNHWSLLALHDNPFELSCVESKPGHEQQVPCSSVITLCKWTHPLTIKKQAGTFWLAEDLSKKQLTLSFPRKNSDPS